MIKVIIERRVVERLETPYEQAIANLLDVITAAPGYRGGESFRSKYQPNHYIVVSNWSNLDAWEKWFRSQDRQSVLDKINPFLEYPEKCTVLERHLYSS